MFNKVSTANRFLIFSITIFLLFWLGMKYFFSMHQLGVEENEPALKLLSVIFLVLNLLLAFVLFRPASFKLVYSESNLINLSFLILLISTLFSTKASAYVTFAFLLFMIVFIVVKKPAFRIHPFLWVMVVYYAFQLLGLLWTIDIDSGIKFFDKGLSFLIIPVTFSFIRLTNNQREKILLFFFRFTTVFLLMGFLGYIFQIYFHHFKLDAGFHLNRIYLPPFLDLDEVYKQIFVGSGYGHPAYSSLLFVLMIPVGFYLWHREKADKLRLTGFELITNLVLSAALIFVLKSRVGMFMYPLGLTLTILFMFRKSKKIPYVLTLIFLLLIVSACVIYKYKIGFAFFSDPIRNNIYSVVFSFISQHPWTGTGTGSMPLELLCTVNQAVNAHNQFVGELFHLGIFGLVVFLVMYSRIIYFALHHRNYMLIYFLIIFTILMLTEMPLAIQKGVSIFTLFCCMYAQPEWHLGSDRFGKSDIIQSETE